MKDGGPVFRKGNHSKEGIFLGMYTNQPRVHYIKA